MGENRKPHLRETLGGDLKQGWDSSERLNERLESFDILKHRTKDFIDWALDGGIPQFDKATTHTFRKLQDCGQYLIFRNYLVSKRARLIGACSCKQHLLCAFCASRRGVKNAMVYKEKVVSLEQENPQLDLVFLTFTVKNCVDLFERFAHLRSNIQALLNRRNQNINGRGKHQTEMSKITGGVFAYEFKRGSGENLWHPHIHMVAHLPKGLRVDIQKLKDEWLELTDDSSVLNIEYCKNDDPYLEVFAYALKFSEMSHGDRWYASQILRGERLISSFGSFRGVDLTDDVTDDLLTTDEPFVDLLFKWHVHRGYCEAITLNQAA